MAKVKIGLRRLTVPFQIERGKMIADKIRTNPAYPNPRPTMLKIDAAINKLELTYNDSRTRDTVKVLKMGRAQERFLKLFTQLAAYVQNASDGDPELILSSGFDIISRGKAKEVGRVSNLRLQHPDRKMLKALWNKMPGTVLYFIQVSSDLSRESAWKDAGVSSVRSFNLTGLSSGTRYWVRVCAYGKNGFGKWSDAAESYVL